MADHQRLPELQHLVLVLALAGRPLRKRRVPLAGSGQRARRSRDSRRFVARRDVSKSGTRGQHRGNVSKSLSSLKNVAFVAPRIDRGQTGDRPGTAGTTERERREEPSFFFLLCCGAGLSLARRWPPTRSRCGRCSGGRRSAMPGRPACTWSSCRRFVADHQRLPELLHLVPVLAWPVVAARLKSSQPSQSLRLWPAICRASSAGLYLVEPLDDHASRPAESAGPS